MQAYLIALLARRGKGYPDNDCKHVCREPGLSMPFVDISRSAHDNAIVRHRSNEEPTRQS